MEPTWRKPVGMLGILVFILVWLVAIASLSRWIGALPAIVQLLIYGVAGVMWIAPLKPALRWMETGRWR
ncbi:DUF2842 domain-containing protein [Sphingomonas sp. 3-13AW]|jgi:hypothetical protein|uniref:DUF2842 domain-containing protein n=1 Tax=Sphingomonas sp. 3-13AW TaxID=3050450 RepID=UPI003BB77AFC